MDYDLTPGQMAGEYRIERKIGEGGFGKVYAAVHPVIGKAAAVKVLNPDLAKNREMVSRFIDEARAVNQIRHRNIIDIFAFGTLPNGLHYFVMELLEGMSLDAYLKRNAPLDPAHALAILWPVGRALVAAHKAGVAHRDLKPENVFLTFDQDGAIFPKLLDFGIAKLLNESEMAHRTRTGVMMGTPLYMSPEQCRGTGVDHRSDIYSFGIMTHEVLTGGQPFVADTMMDLVIMQIGEPAPAMSARRPDLPRSLDAAVLHMLEKSADRRPATMQAALDGLLAAARAGGIEVPSSTHAANAQKPQRPAPAPAAPEAVSAPPLDTGAWLSQGGAAAAATGTGQTAPGRTGPAQPGPGYTAPGGPPVHAALAAPTAAGTAAAAPLAASPVRASHPAISPAPDAGAWRPAGGHSPHPGAVAAPGYSPGHGGAGGYPPGAPGYPHHAPGYPPDQATLQSAGALPPRKSRSALGVFAAIGAGMFFLFVVGLVVLFVATSDSDETIEIGASLPAVGTFVDRDTTADLRMSFNAPGEAAPRLTLQRRAHRWQRITVRAVGAEQVTRADVQYGDNTVTLTSSAAGESSEVMPTANRTYIAIGRAGSIEVSSADGQPISEQERKEVLDDVAPLFNPRADLFGRPIAVGQPITPSSEAVLALLGFDAPDPDTSIRADSAVLKLVSIEPGGQKAVFEVTLLYVEDAASPPAHTQTALKGQVTIDVRTGMPLKGMLTGPLEGHVTESGMRLDLSGSMTVDSH